MKLKDEIKERLNKGERQAFYTDLYNFIMKADEIKRCIAFMEEEKNELSFA